MRSRLDPMKQIARMVRVHRELILNWFRARGQLSNAIVEGFNGKAGVTPKMCSAIALARRWRSCFTIHLAISPSLNSPTNSAGEALYYAVV